MEGRPEGRPLVRCGGGELVRAGGGTAVVPDPRFAIAVGNRASGTGKLCPAPLEVLALWVGGWGCTHPLLPSSQGLYIPS